MSQCPDLVSRVDGCCEMSVEELEVDELPLLLEELVVLGNVLHQDVVGQVNRSLNVAVTQAGHNKISVHFVTVVTSIQISTRTF